MEGNVRIEKEAFVSGLSGTTKLEVSLLIFTTSIGLTLRHVGLLSSHTLRRWHQKYTFFAFFWEYVTIMLPGVLSFTILSDYFIILLPLILILITILTGYIIVSSRRSNKNTIPQLMSFPFPRKPPFVSCTRTWVNIYTAIAILAVDFHIFPRRFAKAETYGTGLMDVGVGGFIFILGFVAKGAKSGTDFLSFKEYWKTVMSLVKSRIWIFVLLGLIRVATVRATDYQLHVSEYGVHWNFFFTIATVKFVVTLLNPIFSLLPTRHSYAIASLLLGIGYQLLLNYTGLREYILMGPNGDYSRNGIISANREGIFSCIGFLSLYCIGINSGRLVFLTKSSGLYIQRKETRDYWNIFLHLVAVLPVSIIITVVVSNGVEEVSRRMANLSYVLWIISFAYTTILVSFVTDILSIFLTALTSNQHESAVSPQYDYLYPTPSSHICLMSAIDYNQFTFFLLANISTGLVNLTINTMEVGTMVALCVVLLHTIGLSVSIIVLKKLNIKLV